MTDDQLLRYSRHILLPELGIEGQARIAQARVLIVGAGGLGSPVAIYLAAAGVGTIVLADGDAVDLTNLQRQILHATASIGQSKTVSGAAGMARLNPEVCVVQLPERLDAARLDHEVAAVDLVLDCTDNFATRHAINRACVTYRKPLVSGAGVRFDGQLSVFDARREDSPCYACLFPEDAETEELRCAVLGVFAPLTGVIGTLQAGEALKLIAGIGTPPVGRLLMFDALATDWRTVRFKRDPVCRVCGHRQPG